MKNAVLFIAHQYTESNLIAYNRLCNELDSFLYDVIWCAPNELDLPLDIKYKYRYDNNYVTNHNGFVNPSYIVERFYNDFRNYDYYYVHEYDVAYTKNYNYLFTNLDTNENADLICAYIKKEGEQNWYWWNKQKQLCDKIYPKHILLKSCLSFARLSNKALEKIVQYPKERNNIIYEISWPTVCYHHNLSILSLDTEESSDEFKSNYELCNSKWYYYTVNINKYNNHLYPFNEEKLYTKYYYETTI